MKRFFTTTNLSPQVLNGGADVFRCIAAEWKNVDPDSVTDSLRQQAKQVQPDGERHEDGPRARPVYTMCRSLQICYGIIYGMGAKSLGEQMGVEEEDAACYIESFKSRYRGVLLWESFPSFYLLVYTHLRSRLSGINAFLKDTVRNCGKNGYVQTLMGRRRYLPGITNTNAHVKAHVNAPALPPPFPE